MATTPTSPADAPAPPAAPQASPTPQAPAPPPAAPKRRAPLIIGIIVLVALLIAVGIWFVSTLGTVSTDDAYVNGHVTFVAPRISGQVARVLVDDNNRVHKGDLLVQIDREPFIVQQGVAQAAVDSAQEDVQAALAQARGLTAQTRSFRFNLETAIEDVDNRIAQLAAKVAVLKSQKATLAKAQSDFDSIAPLIGSGNVSKDEVEQRREALAVAQAGVEEDLQGVYQVRVSLGLPAQPPAGAELTDVPADLDQTFSTVLQAQASLIQAAAQIGVVDSLTKTPRQMVIDFYKRDPNGDINKIYDELIRTAPAVKQAQAKLVQAQRHLEEANLNLKYCDVFAEIDGVVTRRNVNPGNNVVVGQSLMAIRSLTEIWVDANFKETQLTHLRIGQSVDLDVDMYGSHEHFKGRISGFTMGTGSTLALLPAQNATGNFVKVVQRLPVRIDIIDYDPDKSPLFIGLSVEPVVNIKDPPTGPNAGKVLQPYADLPVTASSAPTSTPAPAGSETRP